MNKETLRMQMLAGIITESQYKQKLKESSLRESYGTISQLADNGIKIERHSGQIYLIGDSGEYVGTLDNGKISFSLVDDEEEFDDYNWKDILGPNHVFVKLHDIVGGEVEAIDDYVMITIDASTLENSFPKQPIEKVTDMYGEIQAAEDEFEGALMTGDYIEEDYLQELLDASDEELEDLDGGYYDIARILSDLNGNKKKKAIKNIKTWARIELDHFI
jgi:hypothetical protein